MGRELAEEFSVSREVFAAADRALEAPLSQMCFAGSAEQLALTENTQPSILTVSIAALRALEQRGIRPATVAGHSLGEYSAHVTAGTLDFADAVRIVRLRGRFMQQAVEVGHGAMAAILGLQSGDVEGVCREVAGDEIVELANLNGAGQLVIAGHTAAVERACEGCRRAGAKRAVPLPVSAPFHCTLMQPAAERLRSELERVSFNDPQTPVYTNVDAIPVHRGAAARDALVRQVSSPVRWQDLVEAMLDAGVEVFVEVGPGNVLSGLIRRIRKGVRVLAVSDPAGVEHAAEELGGD
jgi:[acyl-carrier-protein] S-malonyltransferase